MEEAYLEHWPTLTIMVKEFAASLQRRWFLMAVNEAEILETRLHTCLHISSLAEKGAAATIFLSDLQKCLP